MGFGPITPVFHTGVLSYVFPYWHSPWSVARESNPAVTPNQSLQVYKTHPSNQLRATEIANKKTIRFWFELTVQCNPIKHLAWHPRADSNRPQKIDNLPASPDAYEGIIYYLVVMLTYCFLCVI